MQQMREKLLQLASPDAVLQHFKQLGADHDVVDYSEFKQFARQVMPRLSDTDARGMCRLLDRMGDGSIDIRKFHEMMGMDDDKVEGRSFNNTAKLFEQTVIAQRPGGRDGRFGKTPAIGAYGMQMREVMYGYPGSTHYQSERERLELPLSRQDCPPAWQVSDAAVKKKRQAYRNQKLRDHERVEMAYKASTQQAAEVFKQARIDSLSRQKRRYLYSVAQEARRHVADRE